MKVNVSFTLDIDPDEWEGRHRGIPTGVDANDPETVDRITREVRAHAENVVLDLFTDLGWVVENAEARR